MSLKLASLYGLCTVQGPPIYGRRKFGVPEGGAFDLDSMRLANEILGNDAEEACLELGLASGTLISDAAHSLVAVGCEMSIGGSRVASGTRVDVAEGTPIEILQPSGARAYIAVWGGFEAIKDGVAVARSNGLSTFETVSVELSERPAGAFRALRGPQGDDESWTAILASSYRASHRIDRAGIRLEGGPVFPAPELESEPTCVGAIQRTPDGTLIILGPDGPTIGGYPKVAVVCSSDRSRLGQIKPGEEIRFTEIALERARALLGSDR